MCKAIFVSKQIRFDTEICILTNLSFSQHVFSSRRDKVIQLEFKKESTPIPLDDDYPVRFELM